MKKLFAVLLAAGVLASPLAQARDMHGGGPDRVTVEKKKVVNKHRWTKGHRMTAAERKHMTEIRDYKRYKLSAPPRGQRWVKVDNDFLLVSITTGIIAGIIAGR